MYVCLFYGLYLSDDGSVLPDSPILFLQPDIVQQRQRQRLSIAAQDGLALSHVSSSEGEAAPQVGGVVANVTQGCRATEFLPCSSQFPEGKGRRKN